MFMLNKNPKSAASQAAIAHRDNIRKNLERRMAAARAKGDNNLLKMLEAEANYLK
jgi:hypothetical protein